MFNAIFDTHRTEDMIDKPTLCPFIMLYELDAVIGENRVDFIGYCFDQNLKKAGSYELRRFAINPGNDDLRGAIDCNEEKRLTTLVSQLGNVDVEIADLVCFEPLGFLAIGFW